jgi:large conductance mechanosensitive channel
LNPGKIDAIGVVIPPVTINVGNFIQVMVEFLIVAFAIFLMVKFINKMRRHKESTQPEPLPSREEQLLTEIRDLLKK